MTTRPVGRQQPPQRSASSTGALSRPSPMRTLSQQCAASSPARRGGNELDLTLDGDQGRPRLLGHSRLRVEISTDQRNTDTVESPKPISETSSTWRPGLPPRGRPQLHFDVPSVGNINPHADGGQLEQVIKPMPLPVRPRRHAPPKSEKLRMSTGSTPKKDARPKPYVLEVPAIAPHYSPNGHADFYPWTGNHPEDQFSEPIIRGGYYDKAQMTQNETGSARSSIFPALKHKSGFQTLSSLFTTILAQRRAHGKITSASTFKPPPRVTVTDTKREMWLKDLANPTISLRRLSRSIPHGIRGKVLLDQSLSKNIPIERAVWLAKCVGANELRSFRRKGVSGTFAMGGEAKWIRDFTVCVEQFLESIIGSCGEKEFKARFNYAIRLATHFHAEYLLDREHYMEWLVSSLEGSTQARLPLWLLVTQVYWKDLLQYRKHSRRLSGALLKHLSETLAHVDCDIMAPLSDRLKAIMNDLVISNPNSFLAPTTWMKYKDLVFSELGSGDDRFMARLQRIDTRNTRLINTDAVQQLSPRRRIISHLDDILQTTFKNEVPAECWNLDSNKSMLIQTLLGWSTSSYRPGSTKVYVAARILRSWSKFGVDITAEVLTFMDTTKDERGRNKPSFYHLISELTRSDHFSAARYIQWILARGGIHSSESVAPNGPCTTRLLAELPTHCLKESISELRSTLLSRANFSVSEEEDSIETFLASIGKQVPEMQANMDLDFEDILLDDITSDSISSASWTCKSEVGAWLRQQVRLHVLPPTLPPLNEWTKSPTKGGTAAISGTDFNTIRTYLEQIEDFSMLADILKVVSSSNNTDVLASCADTINYHQDIFSAIGALKDLFDILLARLQSLTEDTNSPPRVFLVALLDLASRLEDQKPLAHQLALELARSDRKNAADACSPVSDNMALVEDAEANFTDEIEKVLATGNTIEQATLERLFRSIISRLEESWDKPPEQQRSCGLLLTRLRTFDVSQFDILMDSWVKRLVQMERRPSLVQVCSPLVSFGCLALHSIISSCQDVEEAVVAGQQSARQRLEAIILLASTSTRSEVMTVEDMYRFRIKQVHEQKDFPIDFLAIIRQAFESNPETLNAQHPTSFSEEFFETGDLQQLLQKLILADAESLIQTLLKPLLQSSSLEALAIMEAKIDGLLLLGRPQEIITTEVLLNIADDLSLPFCQTKLATMFKAEDENMDDTEDNEPSSFGAFDHAIESAVAAGNTSWASIVPLLDPTIAQHLRKRAEAQLLSIFPSPRTISGFDQAALQSRAILAENLFRIINATSNSLSNMPINSSLAPDIAAAFNGLWILLANSQSQEVKESILVSWLPLLLSFATVQASVFEPTKLGNESQAKAILALAAIFLQLQALDASSEIIEPLTEQTYDLALYLVDGLSEDMRMQCIRTLKDSGSSPHIYYLFSFASNPSERLMLSQTGPDGKEKLTPFAMRRWEMLGEPTPNVGENDTSLSLTLFGARRG